MIKHPISVKNGKVYGHIIINTTVDPKTKSKPNARNIPVRNYKLKMDNVDLDWLAWKAGQQIGIDKRADWNKMNDVEVRGMSNKTETVAEAYTKTTVVKVDPIQVMGNARVAWRSATEASAKTAAEAYYRGLVEDMVKDMNDKGFPVKPQDIAPDLEW